MSEFTSRWCPYCGSKLLTRHIEERDRKYCEQCDRVIYRNPKPTASVVVVDDSRVLLVKRDVPPDEGEWGVPAGYLEVDEAPREAAVRELAEETSVVADPEGLTLVDTVSSYHETGKSVVSIGYAVHRDATRGTPQAGPDVRDATFWELTELEETASERLRAHDAERVRNAIRTIESN